MKRYVWIGIVILAAAVAADAQTDQTGLLIASVVGADGAPVAGASVALEQLDGSYPASGVTDARGTVRFNFLPPGDYLATASLEGYLERTVTNIRVSAAQTSTVTVQLIPAGGEFSGEIEVTAERPLIETRTTEYDTTLGAEATVLLPSARTASDLVKFTPGGSNQQLWGGSTDQANDYQIDGVTVNSPGYGGSYLLPNVDWIEEFQVKGLGAGAEYGNFQGGMINIVTKSGGNAYHGGVRSYFENKNLADTNLNVREAGFEQDSRWEVNADVGGPVVKDKLYFFFSAQRFEQKNDIVDRVASPSDTEVTFLPVQEKRIESKLFGKLTWDATSRDRLNFVLGWDDLQVDNRNLDSYTSPAAAENQDSPALYYNANWSRTLTDALFMELKVSGWQSDNERNPKHGDVPAVQILGGNREIYSNALYTRNQEPDSLAFDAAFDWFVSTGSLDHSFKIGGQYEAGSWLEERIRNGGYTWRPEEGDGPFDPDDPATWGFISSDWGGTIRLDAETVNAAVYVQDYIDVGPRIRLSAGLRYGIWRGDLTPGISRGSSFEAVSDEAVDPRLGLVWDITGDAQWVAKAHWGRYHQSLFALMFDRVLGGDVFQDVEYWDWAGPGLPDLDHVYTIAERDQYFEFYDSDSTASEVGTVLDYEQPYVDQLVLGIEHALGDQWKVGLTYVNRENKAIVALEDRNLATNYTAFHDVEVVDYRSGDSVLGPDGNPLVLDTIWLANDDILYVGDAPGLSQGQIDALTWNPEYVLTNPDGARREFDQYQLTFDGRGEGWDFNGSVVWTDLTGNFFSVSGYQDPTGIGAGAFVHPNEQTDFQGKLQNYSELAVKLRCNVDLPWNLRAGAYLRYFSGEYYTPSYTIDGRNHDFYAADGSYLDPDLLYAVNGESIFLEPRGSREYDAATLLDLHLDKLIPVGAGTDFIIGFDVFNLLGDDAVTRVETSVNSVDFNDPTSLYGAVRRREDPRTWRLFASFRF